MPYTGLARRIVLQVFFERKIIGHVFGEQVEQFHAMKGLDALKATVADLGDDHPYTALVPSLEGVDPDDSFSRIPYEKGYYFLYYLQSLVGVEAFTRFTAEYLSTFGKQTATTQAFKALVLQHFEGTDAIHNVDWQKWLHEPGTLAPAVVMCPCARLRQSCHDVICSAWHMPSTVDQDQAL